MGIDKFAELSGNLQQCGEISNEEHLANMEIVKTSGKIAENAVARFSLIAESELGYIFHESGVDIHTALEEKAIILFKLNPLIYLELSLLIGRLILIDSKKAMSRLFGANDRTFFVMDEINSYASPVLIDLVNKSRSANLTCVLATQSLSDLDYVAGEAFKEQVIENCNNFLVMRQNSAVNAENWANILGTSSTLEMTCQLQQKGLSTSETGFGSARRDLYHPDEIKSLQTGQGVFLVGLRCISHSNNNPTCSDLACGAFYDYFQHLQETRPDLKGTTVNAYLRGIRATLYYAIEQEYLPRFKVELIKAEKEI
ncbi:MAG: TraG/TraD/VirD4 family protein [Oscillospiraceae bacterium]|nr:TraG/TraD/VirD4 family protein [Oscillospiraceae bacterium]